MNNSRTEILSAGRRWMESIDRNGEGKYRDGRSHFTRYELFCELFCLGLTFEEISEVSEFPLATVKRWFRYGDQHELAHAHVSTSLLEVNDRDDGIGFYEEGIIDYLELSSYRTKCASPEENLFKLDGVPLRVHLKISEAMFAAMALAYSNYFKRLKLSYVQEKDGVNARYDAMKARCLSNEDPLESGTFTGLAFLQSGGDEIELIYSHPLHGVRRKLSEDEYILRSAAYVAAFGLELYPGDLRNGLVHADVKGFIE